MAFCCCAGRGEEEEQGSPSLIVIMSALVTTQYGNLEACYKFNVILCWMTALPPRVEAGVAAASPSGPGLLRPLVAGRPERFRRA